MRTIIKVMAVLIFLSAFSILGGESGMAKKQHSLPIKYSHLLLYCPNINITYTQNGVVKTFMGSAPENSRDIIVGAFRNLPHLIRYGTEGLVESACTVVEVEKPIESLTIIDREHDQYWLAPADIRQALERYAPKGRYDSVHVVFYSGPVNVGFGWGGLLFNNGITTYDSLCVGQDYWWTGRGEAYGEPFLHEWLHGVTSFLRSNGYRNFPQEDLHGASNYGYVHSPPDGWMAWYRDYMRCKVWDRDKVKYRGISRDAWSIGAPTDYCD